MCRALDGLIGQLGIHAPLVTMGRIGVQAIVARPTGHQFRGKKRGLEKKVTGSGTNTAALSAHDARHGQGFLVIRNDQSIRREHTLLTIKQRDALLGLGLSYPYAPFQRVEIKGMQRLAKLEHHVIGDIYHRIDRPDAGTAQSLDHVKWRWSGNIDIANDAPQITRAIRRRCDLDGQRLINRRWHSLNGRRTQRGLRDHCQVTSHTRDAETISPVGCQANFNQSIVEIEIVFNRRTDRRIRRQCEEPVMVF